MEMPIRKLTLADKALADDFFNHLTNEGNMFYNYLDGCRKGLFKQLETPSESRVDFAAFDTAPDGSAIMAAHIFLWHMDTKLPCMGICLREGYTGKHLGGTLLEYLEKYCIEHDCGGLYLTTHVANIRAQTLYRKFGFKYWGTAPSGEFIFVKPFPRS